MFLFGVATGALLAGPITDSAGRNPVYFTSFFMYNLSVLFTALVHVYAT
jgi:MFS transporter, DHA1 family, multidrug resistance protein